MRNKIAIIVLISAIIMSIVVVSIVLTNKENKEENKPSNEKIYNTSDKIKEEYTLNEMLFSDISYYYFEPETYITFNATNTSEDAITFGYFTIAIKDKEGNEMFKMLANIDTPLESGEIKEMQISTLGNFVDGYTLDFEKFEEEFLESE